MRLICFDMNEAARFAATRSLMEECRRRRDIVALIGAYLLPGLDADVFIVGKTASFTPGWREKAVAELCARFGIERTGIYRAMGGRIVPWDLAAGDAAPLEDAL